MGLELNKLNYCNQQSCSINLENMLFLFFCLFWIKFKFFNSGLKTNFNPKETKKVKNPAKKNLLRLITQDSCINR